MNNTDLLEHIAGAFALEGERIRDELRAGMAATDRGNRIDGARYRPLPTYANQPTWNGPARLVGWSLYARGQAARMVVHDGHDSSGDVVAVVDLASLEHDSQWFGPSGVSLTEAVYLEVIGDALNVTGAVYLGAVD